ncbi:MAG TPA: serine hydrolase domain-containing protein [Steroidobacteraceae bacterium]|nr:serine hydrolase domain-containing protein [Steroidobacteraceae bacterium]
MRPTNVLSLVFAALLTSFTSVVSADDNATAAAPASAPAGVTLTATDVDAWLDGYLPYALATADIPGAVVVVVKDGEVLTERGYGYSDVEKKTPVDPKLTLFRPGSVSKLVTWTAVMQQAEAGKIDLDADVNQYLDFKIPPLEGKPVTMRNLMQHTAGFEEQVKGIITEDPKAPSYDALLKVWVPTRIFPVGSTPAYSNYGASLAGYIVERVSGEKFDDYLDKHIFAPLDMKYSSFRQPLPKALESMMSKGYPLGSQPAKPFEIVGPAPAGSMSSPGEDMAHFMIAHLNGGEYHGNRILSAETAEKMHNSPLTLLPPLNRMELGFFETNLNGREVIAHLGDTNWFHTSLHLFSAEKVGFYVSFNSPGKDGAVQGLRWQLFQDFADRYFPGTRAAPGVDAKTAKEHAALMAGNWEVSRGSKSNFLAAVGLIGQTKVGVNEKGELVVPFLGLNGKPRKWIEVAPFVWLDDASHDQLAAKVVDGRPLRFSFGLLSPFMVFDRVAWYQDGAWLIPLLCVGVGVLALTALFWPVTAFVRRRFKQPLVLEPKAFKAYRWSKLAALAVVAGLGLWTWVIVTLFSDLNKLNASSDGRLWFVQLFGAIAFIGGLLAMLWNLKTVWSGRRRWPAKLWSILLVVSVLTVVWVGFSFKLIHFGTNY